MPTLAEELEAESGLRTQCKVCQFLDSLSADERHDWVTQLARPIPTPRQAGVSHAAFVRVLGKRGIEVGDTSVRRHREHHRGP